MCLSEASAGRKLCLPTELRARPTTLSQSVYFRRQDKVVFGKTADGMGRERNADLAPRDGEIGMMSLRLGHNSYFVRKSECLGKIFESILLRYSFSLPRQSPAREIPRKSRDRKLLKEILCFPAVKWHRSSLARHAFL